MKNKIYSILTLILVVLIVFSLTCCSSKDPSVVSLNSQTGIYLKNDSQDILLNGESISVYKTYSDKITLEFEGYHIDGGYENKIVINDKYEFALGEKKDGHSGFVKYSVPLLGLNIINGSLRVKFVAGGDHTDIGLDTYYVRNVVINVEGKTIWSDNYDKNNYINEKLGLGESDINMDLRFGILSEREFNFTVPSDDLDAWGYLLDDSVLGSLNLQIGSKTYALENPKGSYSLTVKDGETITSDIEINVIGNNIKEVYAYMDGVMINLPLKLSQNCWTNGNHTLDVVVIDQTDYTVYESIEFTLEGNTSFDFSTTHNVYNNGAQDGLPIGIDNLGVKIEETENIITPFSQTPFINFEILDNTSKNVAWTGYVNANRTAFLQLYNFKTSKFDTVATCVAKSSDELITLAYNYAHTDDYESNGRAIARVSSVLYQSDFTSPDGVVQHVSDVQYIVQRSAAQGDSSLGRQAKNALTAMQEYIIKTNPDYAFISGDLVQKTVDEQEWKDVIEYLVDPILNGNVPLGVSSGNHDVGGLVAVNPDGSNGLDDVLVYDLYEQYVGESKFGNLPYYGGSFENNRSHYDIVTVAGHEFLFLHLGWGSTAYGVHVSSKDIKWAKEVLEMYPDKTVVLSTHEYLNSYGGRTATGEYVFNELVKKYSNIYFVFSGHINGSSSKIDYIDDNSDGMNDRVVLQLLTDYQEEEQLLGATFIRNLFFYKDYNNILFDIYSPVFVDNDIEVFENHNAVKSTSRFEYAFDIVQDGFGIKTVNFR